jgi:hypothetical protein
VTRIQPVADAFGVVRGGPARAWWPHLRPRLFNGIGISYEIPQWRLRAWNVAALAFAAGDLYVAHRLGLLGWLLVTLAGLAVAEAVGLVLIQLRIDRNAAERLAAYWAARAVPLAGVDPGAEQQPAPERELVAA